MERVLRPMKLLSRAYDTQERKLEFEANSVSEWDSWRKDLRAKLVELTGVNRMCEVPLSPVVTHEKNMNGYVRQTVLFDCLEGLSSFAYVLVPQDNKQTYPAVIALHGHGYGVDDVVGIREDGTERDVPQGYQKDFAIELVRRGFVVIAPEIYCFGRSREDKDKAEGKSQASCRQVSFLAMLLGLTAVGVRIWQTMKSIDYLMTRSDVDGSRIGCMGISGGGMLALHSAAIDERIKVCVVSGYLNTYKDSIGSILHCECNYIPRILEYAEMHDVASLIAPRPFLAENGTKDTIFPISAAMYAFDRLKEAYDFLGVPERVDMDVFNDDHQISGAKSYDWLVRWLG